MRACGEMTHDYPSKQACGIHWCGREEKTKRVRFVRVFKKKRGRGVKACSEAIPSCSLPPIHIFCCSLINTHTTFLPQCVRDSSGFSETMNGSQCLTS